jgi:NADPH-dependent 2,4-dienoyl-CoA reductase/sulfur reductase-like enzyme
MQHHSFQYVILGGGVGAGYAAQEFAEQGIEPGQLAIVSADDTLPYDRPALSKGYLAGKKTAEDILINDPAFYDQHGIQVFLSTRVTGVGFAQNRLDTDADLEIQFDKLLIATGSHVRKLDLPGADLAGIHYLRSRAQSEQIAAAMQQAQHVVVIGGGYIGMEVSSVLAEKQIDVTMVFPEKRLMERLFTPQMSAFFGDYYAARGVSLRSQTLPTAFIGDDHVARVQLNTDQEIPADFVVAGIGVTPAFELFEGTGLHLDNGIVVNKYLETNRNGVYAAGDVANYNDLIFQKRRRIEHWDNAVQQARHAARMMIQPSRKQSEEFVALRYFFSDIFDLSYEFWGDTAAADSVIHRGDMQEGRFSVWWLAGQRLEAAFVMNRPDEERDLAPEWIRTRRRVLPERLQDANVPPGSVVTL